MFFEEFKDGSDTSLPFLPVGLQSERVYTSLKPSHKRIISAVTTQTHHSTLFPEERGLHKSFLFLTGLLSISSICYNINVKKNLDVAFRAFYN